MQVVRYEAPGIEPGFTKKNVGCVKPYDLPLIYASCAHPIVEGKCAKEKCVFPMG